MIMERWAINSTLSVSAIALVIWFGTALQTSSQVQPATDGDEARQADHISRLSQAQIKTMQQWLANLGYDPGQPDGLPGRRTADAIRDFEADRGLSPRGEATASILGLIEAAWREASAAPSEQTTRSSPEQEIVTGLSCAELIADARFAAPVSSQTFDQGHDDHDDHAFANDVHTEAQVFYSNESEDILVFSDQPAEILAGNGDDRIFVFDPPMGTSVFAEGGANTIHICSLAAPLNMLGTVEGDVGLDSDRDTIIVHPAAFAAATDLGDSEVNWMGTQLQISGAELWIMGFDARTDRIILRSTEEIIPQVVSNRFGQTEIKAGPISLKIVNIDLDAPNPLEAITVERAEIADLERDQALVSRLPAMLQEMPAESGTQEMDAHSAPAAPEVLADDPKRAAREGTCETVGRYTRFDAPEVDNTPEAHDSRETFWTDRDDLILHRGTGERHDLFAGGGDDQIWVYDLSPGSQITAGRGADLVVLCSMQDISGVIALGTGQAEPDEEPDTLVIGPEVLQGIAAGFDRQLMVMEFQPETDILVLPPSDDAYQIGIDAHGFDSLVTYGPLRIQMHHANMQGANSVRAAIQIASLPAGPHLDSISQRKPARALAPSLPVTAESWAKAFTIAGGPAFGEIPMQNCGDAQTVQGATPLDQPDHDERSAMIIQFGDTDDTVVLRSVDSDPQNGIRSESAVDTGGGGDLIYLLTANATVSPGAGADTIVVCELDALAMEFVARKDGAPDTIIIDSTVLLSPIAEGVFRRLTFTGFGDQEDRLVIRAPEDVSYEWLGFGLDVVAGGHKTRFSLGAHPLDEPPLRSLTPEQIIIWPVAVNP